MFHYQFAVKWSMALLSHFEKLMLRFVLQNVERLPFVGFLLILDLSEWQAVRIDSKKKALHALRIELWNLMPHM